MADNKLIPTDDERTQWSNIQKSILSAPSTTGWVTKTLARAYLPNVAEWVTQFAIPDKFLPGTLTIWVDRDIQWEGADYMIVSDRFVQFKTPPTKDKVIRARYIADEQRLIP